MNQKYLKYGIYFGLFLLPFVLFFLQPKPFQTLRQGVVSGISQPLSLISFPFREIKKILFYHRTFKEYIRLRSETEDLRARLIGQEQLQKENARLQSLLDFREKLVYSSLAAAVIGRNPVQWNSSILINRGAESGIRPGQPVLMGAGVVGKVAEAFSGTSKVLLLTDPQFSVAAVVRRSRDSGLVSGTLQGFLRMSYLEPDADVRVGDEVITSKLSGSFPEGIFIGTITEVRDIPGERTVECLVSPAIPLGQLEEVLVLLTAE